MGRICKPVGMKTRASVRWVMASHVTLFRATIKAKHLKSIVASTKAITDLLTLQADGRDDDSPLQFWCRDARGQCAVCGSVDVDAFADVDGADEVAFTVASKHLTDTLGMFEPASEVTIDLYEDGDSLFLSIEQSGDDSSDRRVIEVEDAAEDDIPYDEDLRSRDVKQSDLASAMVDLPVLGKVLMSNKRHTDSVTIRVADPNFEVVVDSRKANDTWTHLSPSVVGEEDALVDMKLFHSMVNGAKQIADTGEVFILDKMIRVETVDEHLSAHFYMGRSEVL